MTWYDVYSLVEGCEDKSLTIGEDGDPYEAASVLADDLRAVSAVERFESWEVYVLPHYCDRSSDDECVCVQYLTDHRPTYEGGEQ